MAFKPSFNPQTGLIKVLVRLSFCKVFEKTASFENGALKYRTNGLIMKNTDEGKAQIKVINEAIKHLAAKEWPGKELANLKEQMGDGPKGRWPVFDGDKYLTDDGEKRDGYADARYLKLSNDRKVKVRDRRGNDVDDDEKFNLFQSGHWAIAYFHLYAIKDKAKGGNGIFTTLDALQFYKRDETFSGGGISDDEIEDYGDDEDDDLGGSASSEDDDL